ncbi:MAG: hypothetical protein PF961_22600 [Planctomycetota bacterium]|jgi:hypothetical protein|nr:hypothetical protein [Planctomycetota bacterium]
MSTHYQSALRGLVLLSVLMIAPLWSAEELVEKDWPWATVSVPVSAAPGEEFTVKIAVKETALTADNKLWAGLHLFIDGKRKPTGSYNKPAQELKAGVASDNTFTFKMPNKPGLQAVSVVVWVSPTGGWKDKVLNGGIGVKTAAQPVAEGE